MIQTRDIKKWCEIVAREFRPERIILFGSYANGKPTEDSDVDVLVIMPLTRPSRCASSRDNSPTSAREFSDGCHRAVATTNRAAAGKRRQLHRRRFTPRQNDV